MRGLILFTILGCIILMVIGYFCIHPIACDKTNDTIYIVDTIYYPMDISNAGPEV